MKAVASGAGGRPVRKPWNPPRFETVDVDLMAVGHGKQYFDHDDASTPGGGVLDDPDIACSTCDQANPYNS